MFRRIAAVHPSFRSKAIINLRAMSGQGNYAFETLAVSQPAEYVFNVELNRPDKRNAMNRTMWREIPECFERLAEDTDCRVVVFSGSGKMFTAGIDLIDHMGIFNNQESEDVSRKAWYLRKFIKGYQHTFTAIENCPKPVIAAIHGGCIGGGASLVTACDIRYASRDAYFCVKEVDVGLAADVGALQRLPRVVGSDSLARELVYTARNMPADEALSCGLFSRLFDDREALLKGAVELAKLIASKSPVSVQGSKVNLIYSRDHGVPDGLNFVASWNAAMIQSEDTVKAGSSFVTKEKPVFSKL